MNAPRPASGPPRRGFPARSMLFFLLLLALFGVGLNLLPSCGLNTDRFRTIALETVDGTPYLLVENAPVLGHPDSQRGMFYIYKPATPDFASWETVLDGRAGPVYGTFLWNDSEGSALGVLHYQSATLYRFGSQGTATRLLNLPFEWIPETGMQLGGRLYVFGADFKPARPQDPVPLKAPLHVAEFDGQEFKELKLEGAPEIERGRAGFWLRAVYHQGQIQVFWRGAESTAALDLEPALTFSGPLKAASFDGKAFGPGHAYATLPGGYTTIWSDGMKLRAAVQTPDPSFARSASPRLFMLDAAGGAEEDPVPAREDPSRISFKFYTLDRIPAEAGAEAFLRSNSQVFEVWRRAPEGWQMQPRPRGLPENGMERLLLAVFALSVTVVAMGLGLAFRRRRQVLLIAEKLRPSDALAPLSLRISAHLLDLGLVATATEVYTWAAGLQNDGLLSNLMDLELRQPYYFGFYVGYMTLTESLAGGTLGKLAMGLRVVSDKGEGIGLWPALVRNLIGFYERHPMISPFLSLPTILLTPSSQRLGDMLARTLVVQKAAMERLRLQRASEKAALQAAGGAGENSSKPSGSEEGGPPADGKT